MIFYTLQKKQYKMDRVLLGFLPLRGHPEPKNTLKPWEVDQNHMSQALLKNRFLQRKTENRAPRDTQNDTKIKQGIQKTTFCTIKKKHFFYKKT